LILSKTADAFLALTSLGIDHSGISFPDEVRWSEIKVLADRHGLSAIALDGIEKLPEYQRPTKETLLQWIGETFQGYDYRYDAYCRAIAELAGFYNHHDFKMMVLKGYACSQDWPKPEHRPCGDIDIWIFGKQKFADALLAKEEGLKIDNTHHHHTVFIWQGFMVENHYDFLNIHHHKSNVELETILKELGAEDSYFVELYGEKVYLPSPHLHALFLLRHMMSNFASTGMQFRQLIDWALFVEKHGKEVDWGWLDDIVERFGMTPIFQIFNAICVEDLGFDPGIFPVFQYEPILKERVLNEIITPEFSEVEKGGIISRAIYKYRRWKANAWKHKLCYRESMWSAFWSGVKSHLMKPSSI